MKYNSKRKLLRVLKD